MTNTDHDNTNLNTPRILGAAFLLQAVASGIGVALLDSLIVPGSIVESMINIANNPLQMRASIVAQMITALGVAMLGVLMYLVLKKQNKIIALVAMGFYLVEAAILAASRMPMFALLHVSLESHQAGHPESLQFLADLFYESALFGEWLHMLPFAIGATLFYTLFYRSRYIPRILSLWGIIAASIAVVGTLLVLFGIELPIIVFIPNLPFELAIGLWLLIKGINDKPIAIE
jgi:hypothetical protein